jgi:hypothetical protein
MAFLLYCSTDLLLHDSTELVEVCSVFGGAKNGEEVARLEPPIDSLRSLRTFDSRGVVRPAVSERSESNGEAGIRPGSNPQSPAEPLFTS